MIRSVQQIARCSPQLLAATRGASTVAPALALPISRSTKKRSSEAFGKSRPSRPMASDSSVTAAAAAAAAASDSPAPPPAPKKFSLLFYSYVPDILERRDPYRAAHIQGAKDAVERGEMTMAGALAEPVDGAIFVFAPETSAEKIEAFAKNDPYVLNGLVTEWKIRPWMVVAG